MLIKAIILLEFIAYQRQQNLDGCVIELTYPIALFSSTNFTTVYDKEVFIWVTDCYILITQNGD